MPLKVKFFSKQIKGFIGIGSAPEFLERVMWKNFSKKMKRQTIKNGVYHLKHGEYEYPITFQLIQDGRKNKVLHKRINLKIEKIDRKGIPQFVPIYAEAQLFYSHAASRASTTNKIPQMLNNQIFSFP